MCDQAITNGLAPSHAYVISFKRETKIFSITKYSDRMLRYEKERKSSSLIIIRYQMMHAQYLSVDLSDNEARANA